MARFNPETYPDRLTFHAHARRIRAQEFDRIYAAARTWLATRRDEFIEGIARPAGSGRAGRPLHH